MQTLREIIDKNWKMNDTHIILPGFLGYIRDEPYYIHSILERTAIVSPVELLNGHVREVVNFAGIKVWQQDVKWIPRPRGDTSMRVSTKLARTNYRLRLPSPKDMK